MDPGRLICWEMERSRRSPGLSVSFSRHNIYILVKILVLFFIDVIVMVSRAKEISWGTLKVRNSWKTFQETPLEDL